MVLTLKPANTMKEAAEALNIGHQKLYDVINSGQLRTYTVGRRRYVSDEAIRQFIRAREEESNKPAA